MDQLFLKSAVTSAQIRCDLNLVNAKHSMNSSSYSGDLFSVMFPDSDITKRFQCGRNKAGYFAHFGLPSDFYELMLSKLSNFFYFFIFWWILKQSVQKAQMDIIIRFWYSETSCGATRYLGSKWVGEDEDVLLRKKFYNCFLLVLVILTSQKFNRLLRTVRMWDGPSPSEKKYICFNDSPPKMMKKAFYLS